jgi:hypothetical protein
METHKFHHMTTLLYMICMPQPPTQIDSGVPFERRSATRVHHAGSDTHNTSIRTYNDTDTCTCVHTHTHTHTHAYTHARTHTHTHTHTYKHMCIHIHTYTQRPVLKEEVARLLDRPCHDIGVTLELVRTLNRDGNKYATRHVTPRHNTPRHTTYH